MTINAGQYAFSLMGHDKGELFVVIDIDEEKGLVYLADGKSRKVEKPKKKNIKHIQIINKTDEEIAGIFASGIPTDEEIKRAIKRYVDSKENGGL